MTVMDRPVLVVEALDEIPAAPDGQVAIVLIPSDHRDGGRVRFERWMRVGGRWVRDDE